MNGLSQSDYQAIVAGLQREPNPTEIGIFSAMWSEHCSYRSSKPYLRNIISQGPQVIEGPGENAGIVDIGDGLAAVFKMESHNHPSFIEPYQGAATAIGGIMRDIFTMGARPVAFLDALRFGAPDHPKTRSLLEGVVAGIGFYGNCVGVPTVGGELDFDSSYNGNILVNAMCVGIVEQDRIFRSRLEVGCQLLYVGARTGRDGIHGAVMASAAFEGDEADRTSIQIGDPFLQKLLLEACLEIMQIDGIIGLQDMGAAGLTSSSVEMAAKSHCGITLNLDAVPCREDDMSVYEIMLSESQERMLIAIRPEAEPIVKQICDKWDMNSIPIGQADNSNRLTLRHHGDIVADLPIPLLAEGVPQQLQKIKSYKRPPVSVIQATEISLVAALEKLLTTAELSSRDWISEQYDHSVMGDTLQASGGDAALVRVHSTEKALALTTEVTPRYCLADPYEGAKQAVAECFRNIIAVGATPLAITDCLNFANPEDAYVMGQFTAAIQGLSEAARSLDMPIVSGNVSFYNETDGKAIIPTPAIGAVGLIEDYQKAVSLVLPDPEMKILLIGDVPQEFSGMTLYQKYIQADDSLSAPPFTDLEKERRYGLFVRDQIHASLIGAAHDIGSGGLAIALAEMALASAQGIIVHQSYPHHFFFSEDQARYLIACKPSCLEQLNQQASQARVPLHLLGESGGQTLDFAGEKIALSVLKSAYLKFLPALMAQ